MTDKNPLVLVALEVWAAAAWADGKLVESEAAGIRAVIDTVRLTAAERAQALGWLTRKVELDDVNVSQIPAGERANIFAAALGVVAVDEQVAAPEHRFLQRLQVALQLDDPTVRALRARTGV